MVGKKGKRVFYDIEKLWEIQSLVALNKVLLVHNP